MSPYPFSKSNSENSEKIWDYLPIDFVHRNDKVWVQWLHLGSTSLRQPFYSEDVQALKDSGRDRLLLPLEPHLVRNCGTLAPVFIFHTSRCGSTLVSQMLRVLERFHVVSEPGVFNKALVDEELSMLTRGALLRELLSGLMARPHRTEMHMVFKLTSWNLHYIDEIRRFFPKASFFGLYRSPAAVLDSWMRRCPPWLKPNGGHRYNFGETPTEIMENLMARLISEGRNGLKLINYSTLPGAVERIILSELGVQLSGIERSDFRNSANCDSKVPGKKFQTRAPSPLPIPETRLEELYEELESLRSQ